jgi:oxygen-independent coproporphyrinogen III oxidase
MKKQPAGIYIHVPFCVKRCRYCDFYSQTDLALRGRFTDALLREIALAPDPGAADSIYFGGGTPSLLDPSRVARIIQSLRARFSIRPDTEITLEVNPGTADRVRLSAFKAAGVNRLNLGIQSFDDDNLVFLGRIHTASEAVRAIDAARAAGFDNLGLDLIYGLPGQTAADLRQDLEKAAAFNPEHLSAYLLTYEKGTLLDRDRMRGAVVPLPENPTADLFLLARELLETRGYAQYEISNFSRSGNYRSRHNCKYWTFAPYLGLGPAAHAYLEPVRSWNHRDLAAYLADLDRGRLPISEKETLTAHQQMIEAVYLGLRQTRGISIPDFKQRFSVDFRILFAPVLSDPALDRLLEPDTDFCRLTPQGMLVMDTIMARFVDLIPLG